MTILQKSEKTSRTARPPTCFLANDRFAGRTSTKSKIPAPQRLNILKPSQKPFDYGTDCFLPNLFVFGSPTVELHHASSVFASASLIWKERQPRVNAGLAMYWNQNFRKCVYSFVEKRSGHRFCHSSNGSNHYGSEFCLSTCLFK
jgi:hypothetical protein